ncbi:MAG: dihydrodipicolinate synthase family protein, partial [Nanoarchaeota archaeon]|nr:dihydrodipicolinate synthase family protein [Nanoarchaeota archaeon]
MFKGAITAIVTPFKEDESLDEEALRGLVDFQLKNNIDGIVPCGTTGESPTLDHDEHQKVIEIIIDAVKGKVPVIAGTGSNSTREAIKMTKEAADAGANASLQVCPYYNKPTQ